MSALRLGLGTFGNVLVRNGLLVRRQGVVSEAFVHRDCFRGLPALLNYDGTSASRSFHSLSLKEPTKLLKSPSVDYLGTGGVRTIGWIASVVRGVLKIRYLLLGGAIGGGATLARQYEEWKKNLPNTEWIKGLIPDVDVDKFRASLIKAGDNIKGKAKEIDMDPALRSTLGKLEGFRQWFERRLDDAKTAAEEERARDLGHKKGEGNGNGGSFPGFALPLTGLSLASIAGGDEDNKRPKEERERTENEKRKNVVLQKKLEAAQEELMKTQIRYQKELEKLEKENRELRKQLLLRSNSVISKKKIKKSLIDMYSEVLDELSGYDSSYNTADHLPRVVVIGDQSSGKTSVLEMIAQARIFPRGGGEMMTRAPVKVTLSEGPYHVAQFKDSQREFDLTKESDLSDLRREVEMRMKNSVSRVTASKCAADSEDEILWNVSGSSSPAVARELSSIGAKTISSEVISMTVKGPGLQRMVLVDLPGVIGTVTTELDPETGNAIKNLARQYMSNPNAIILCIQDGSVDAERSNVTDLVSNMDPSGKRTIFVLTKVDLAEKNLADPNRIQKILSGQLFPMKALGYFAVVTGKGNKEDTIQSIREYEEKFFASSKIFRGLINSTQITTRNLSFAVSECFWKMVRDTIEQQADAFKATRFNLETEWKNNFPRIRELDRDELFEKARGEILDEVVNLSLVSTQTWEDVINRKLWEKLAPHVFENIYLPAAQGRSSDGSSRPISTHNKTGTFNTTVDIKLKQWAENKLGEKCVEVGWEVLQEQFQQLMDKSTKVKDHDNIFDSLKAAVVAEAMRRHVWEEKGAEMLRVIQLNVLEDCSVHDKNQWDSANRFLEASLQEKLQQSEANLRDLVGPGLSERWFQWKSATQEQYVRAAIKTEMEKFFVSNSHPKSHLSAEEVTAVKRNLQTSQIEVDNELIRETWHPVYRRNFLREALARCHECRRGFYMYTKGLDNDLDCYDMVLFWRIQQMLKVTANAIRQQVMNREARRLEREIKEVLEEFSQDPWAKEKLLTGRRVQIAEELKSVRQIQEKLEEFIKALNTERE